MGKKPDVRLITMLQSGNESDILHTLHYLRSMGNPDYLPYIFPLLLQPAGVTIRIASLELLSNLKYQKAVPLLIRAIADPKYLEVRKDLIACCWQSGLDFSDQLSYFADLVIENDFDIAFEAFTVIDSMENIPTDPDRERLMDRIQMALNSSSGTKASLLQELYNLFR